MCCLSLLRRQDFTKLQFDLFANLKVEKVVYKGQELPYTREYNAVFVTFPQTIQKAARRNLRFITPATQQSPNVRPGMAVLNIMQIH